MNRAKYIGLLAALLLSTHVLAETRASVNRTSIRADEHVQLVIETDSRQAPNESGFNKDFVITARSTGRNISYTGGKMRISNRFEYELSPRRAGRIIIPPLRVGADTTSALVVDVSNAAASAYRSPNNESASNAQDVFIQTSVDTNQPYAQQGVLMTVRFFVGRSLIDAALDQPSPSGATVQQLGTDLQTTENLNGRNFQVVTRRYWVVPDQAGRLRIPGARLVGTTAGGFFDETFGDGIERVNAVAKTVDLAVQAQPDNAASPWLPLSALSLRFTELPRGEIAQGQSGRVTVEMVAESGMPVDLPEINLLADNAAQIYPEPAQSRFEIRNGRLVSTVSRTFSVLPTQGGEVSFSVPDIVWWNIPEKRNALAQLKTQTMHVPGESPEVKSSTSANPAQTATTSAAADVARWVLWALGVLLLIAVAFVASKRVRRSKLASMKDAALGGASISGHSIEDVAPPAIRTTSLKTALASGELSDISDALSALSTPPTNSLEAVRARLANPDQREAVSALQAALWGGADREIALKLLRTAFMRDPEWVVAAPKKSDERLPPLYPTR